VIAKAGPEKFGEVASLGMLASGLDNDSLDDDKLEGTCFEVTISVA
jgi:hypothetical protein